MNFTNLLHFHFINFTKNAYSKLSLSNTGTDIIQHPKLLSYKMTDQALKDKMTGYQICVALQHFLKTSFKHKHLNIHRMSH